MAKSKSVKDVLGVDPKQIRMCVDRILPPKLQMKAAELAMKENPENRPHVPAMTDARVRFARRDPQSMALITGKKWQNGRTLKIAFLNGNSTAQALVRETAPQWLQFANIKFEWVTNPANADIRIDYTQVGAWSHIGTDCLAIPKNQATMNYGFIDQATCLHEFGHALGCIHEHQHPEANIPWNKPAVYAYYGGPPNNWNRQMVDVNLFEKYSRDITQFSDYDTSSIMHYPIDPRLTDGRFTVGWNKALSPTDKKFMAQMYPGAGTTTPTDPGTGGGAIAIPKSGSYTIQTVGGKAAIVFN